MGFAFQDSFVILDKLQYGTFRGLSFDCRKEVNFHVKTTEMVSFIADMSSSTNM